MSSERDPRCRCFGENCPIHGPFDDEPTPEVDSNPPIERDPAVIAKLLGWHRKELRGFAGVPELVWVNGEGHNKTKVRGWNPYTSDADALMALFEWEKLDGDNGWTLSGGRNEWRGCALWWYTTGHQNKVYEDGTTLPEAITTALGRWYEADILL